MKRGVDCKAKDNFGRTALHYAVMSESISLVKMLLSSGSGYDPNEVDNSGHTPLSLYFKGKKTVPYDFYHPVFKRENIFYLLSQAGADVNFVYPEEIYKPDLKDDELEEDHIGQYEPQG